MTFVKLPDQDKCTIAVIGLGYVGLPLAIEFAKNKNCKTKSNLERKIIGFDISLERINKLRKGVEITKEITSNDLKILENIQLTSERETISKADVFIVTVPTPINEDKTPNLNALKKASETIGKSLKNRNQDICNPIIIFESTVFPGATEEICIPIIEKESNLKLNEKFYCGYSPERINPGENVNKLNSIIKVTSGSNKLAAIWIDEFYKSIIKVGTYMTSSIKIAEAAKVIENTQRDLNIALMNELAKICNLIGIDTLEVIKAASTKWNFIDFKPGLVGGHCIGVDPYYLTYKSESLGYIPKVVLAGREINNSMSQWILEKVIKEFSKKEIGISKEEFLIMGITFKENCPDIRNSKVIDLINKLLKEKVSVTVWDSFASYEECLELYNLKITNNFPKNKKFSAVLCLVAHNDFKELKKSEWESILKKNGVLFDLKGIVPTELNPIRP